eukprot:6214402-Pleurochrysis_carterae.AAC.3
MHPIGSILPLFSVITPRAPHISRNCRRAPDFTARMHSFPTCMRIERLFAERSRSAPQALDSPLRRLLRMAVAAREQPDPEPPWRCA